MEDLKHGSRWAPFHRHLPAPGFLKKIKIERGREGKYTKGICGITFVSMYKSAAVGLPVKVFLNGLNVNL
jgi:hypothetical protein